MIKGYLTAKDLAGKWELSPRRVRVLCSEGRIPGAERIGRIWFIPEDAKRPEDARVKSGLYKNWRKSDSVENV